MPADQNHHYLPQSYQRGWAQNRRVHVYRWRHDRLVCDPKSTRSTGARRGLYYIPMALPDKRNFMEDVFWKTIDQWGHDGLTQLRSKDPTGETAVNVGRMAIYLNALILRNPLEIAAIEAEAKRHVLEMCLEKGYAQYRQAHHPVSFEVFKQALEQPGMTEHGAACLKEAVLNGVVREKVAAMDWHLVTVSNSPPLLTADAPLIRYKGLADDDGLWLLPVSPTEFLAIFNRGEIDMVRSIEANIREGVFVEAMNKYLVQHRIDYVYGVDDSQMGNVGRYWAVGESDYRPITYQS